MDPRLSRRERHQVRTERVNGIADRDPVRVLIVGARHPHRGETGRLAAVATLADGGPPMVRVDLEEHNLGADACYAEAADLIPVTHSYGGVER